MDIKTIREQAFAMPLASPAYPLGPCRFLHREFFFISCRTAPALLRPVAPEPPETADAVVSYLDDHPPLENLGTRHYVADLTLGLGEVVFDYLA